MSLCLLGLVKPQKTSALGGPTDDVGSCAQLEALNSDSHASDDITLTSDIDCTGQTVAALFPNGYHGTFNGQGHTIRGFVLNDPSGDSDGLFSSATGATFENVTLTDGSVASEYEAGALLGSGSDVNVTNVSSDWTVTAGIYYAGGLIGGLGYDTSVASSYNLNN
ncbi:MAG TPA: hypothetical protein VMB52_06885, partial [Verrucomicrobiae bacterium]|nr:hypothetical protein [Verrucomicrobiae bacterium]